MAKTRRSFLTITLLALSGAAVAQQSEFIAPDAGFKSAASRAAVREELGSAPVQMALVQHQHDGMDTPPPSAMSNRGQMRVSEIRPADKLRPGDTRDIYFGD